MYSKLHSALAIEMNSALAIEMHSALPNDKP